MRIIRSKVLGYCSGVNRAVETALEASRAGHDVYTIGPLIHNPVVLKNLKDRGIKVLEEGETPPANSTVIIRAHGLSPRAEEALAQGLRVIDATCPHVKLSQEKAGYFAEKGYWIFLAGEKGHAEIAGIRGFAVSAPECFVVGNPSEAEAAAAALCQCKSGAKTVLIGQTTISPGEYKAIGDGIRRYFPGLEIINTICSATAKRQEALRELCNLCDALIIIGGRESANTRRLLSLVKEMGKPAWLVETAADIPPEIYTYDIVGLSAGASTPGDLIDEIEAALNRDMPHSLLYDSAR